MAYTTVVLALPVHYSVNPLVYLSTREVRIVLHIDTASMWYQKHVTFLVVAILTRLSALETFPNGQSYNFDELVSFRQSSTGKISGAERCHQQIIGNNFNGSYLSEGLLARKPKDGYLHGRFEILRSENVEPLRVRLTFGYADTQSYPDLFKWDQLLTEQSTIIHQLSDSLFALQLTLDHLRDRQNMTFGFHRSGRYFIDVGIESQGSDGTIIVHDCVHLHFRLHKIIAPLISPDRSVFQWAPYHAVRFQEMRAYRMQGWNKKTLLLGATPCVSLKPKLSKGGVVRYGFVAVREDAPSLHGYVRLVLKHAITISQIRFVFDLRNDRHSLKVRRLLESGGDVLQIHSVRTKGDKTIVKVEWQLSYAHMLPAGDVAEQDRTNYNLDISVRVRGDRTYGCYGFQQINLTSPTALKTYRPILTPPSSRGVYDWGDVENNHTRYAAPALFEVLDIPTTAASNALSLSGNGQIGPFSFTVGESPSNSIFSGAFEPMSFRYRFNAEPPSAGNTFRADTSLVQQYASGLFDNAEVRIFRLVNGVITQIRSSIIARSVATGWEHVFLPDDGGFLFLPTVRQIEMRLPNWHAYPSMNWFKVVALTADGQESNGPHASVHLTYVNNGDSVVYDVHTTTAGRPVNHYGDSLSTVTAPSNLTAQQDPTSGKIILSWDFDAAAASVAGYDIIGFRFYRSDTDPMEHEGWFLELEDDGGSAILPNDMAYVYQTLYSWSRIKYSNKRVYGTPKVGPTVLSVITVTWVLMNAFFVLWIMRYITRGQILLCLLTL